MKKTKRLFLTLVSLCMLFVTIIGSNVSVFAQQPDINAAFEEVLNEAKTESTITMNLQYDQTKFQVDKIVQPDKSEILPQENTPLVTTTYISKENGSLDFEITYTNLTSNEVKSEKFSYEVNDIELAIIDEKQNDAEDTYQENPMTSPNVLSNPSREISNRQLTNGDKIKVDDVTYEIYQNNTAGVDGFSNGYDGLKKEQIIIPESFEVDGVTFTVTKVEQYAFIGDKTMKYIEIPNTVTEIGKNAFSYIDSPDLQVKFPDNLTYLAEDIFTNSNIKSIDLSNTKIEEVDRYAFKYCKAESIKLPDTVKILRQEVFNHTVNLKVFDVPESLEYIGSPEPDQGESWGVFCDTGLTELHLPESVKRIGKWAISQNPKLKIITMGSNIYQIDQEGISDNPALEVLKLPTNGRFEIGLLAFQKNISLKELTVYERGYMSTSALRDCPKDMKVIVRSAKLMTKQGKGEPVYEASIANGIMNVVYGNVTKMNVFDSVVKVGLNSDYTLKNNIDFEVNFPEWVSEGITWSIKNTSDPTTEIVDGVLHYGANEHNTLQITATSDWDVSKKVTFDVKEDANVVTYHPMGGTMDISEMVARLHTGEKLSKPTDPTFVGYNFEGWYTDDRFTTEWNFDDVVTTDMTLYAKWNPLSYRIHFDANTGTGTMTDMNYGIGESITLSKNTFTKVGFEFIGWNTSADGTGASYNDEAIINSTPADSITLYAQWKAQGPSVFVEIPKSITLKDDSDGYAKQSGEVKIIKNIADEAFYPDEDILIRTSTNITLSNDKSADTFLVDVFKSDASQYVDGTSPLITLNVKDDTKQSDTFTLKTKMSNSKTKNLYKGIMNFIIEFRP